MFRFFPLVVAYRLLFLLSAPLLFCAMAFHPVHHKQLSLIVEETESKLRLEMESDGSFRKQSVGSSITSSSSSSTGGGSTPARSATVVVASRCQTKDTSPPHDLLLTETTEEEEEEDDALKGKSSDSGQHPYQMVARSDGGTGAGSAILELAWRVVVSLLFLGLFRPRNQQQRQPSATMKTPDDSGGAAASVVDAVDDECTFLTPPPSPQSSSLLRRHGGDRDQEEGSGFT